MTLAPFGRRLCPVVAHQRYGAYDVISVLDAEGPAPDPGQFYMLAASERWGGGADERPFLPRAFSVLRRHEDGRLDFLFEDVGPGTRRLCQLRAGDALWLLGPLGVGFRDAPHAHGAELIPGAQVATDDGSAGHHGLVTDLVAAELAADRHAEVYACGPPPMLEAVRALCAERDVPAQLALESGMACGYGACFGCVVPTTEGYLRLCVDGPVLDASEVERVHGI